MKAQVAMNFIMNAKIFLISVVALGGPVYWALLPLKDRTVIFESLESKTIDENPVYNKIAFFSFKEKDVWMMNQSHFGLQTDKSKWDRLAIVVDKNKSPKEVEFMQLSPGELIWNDNLMGQKINFKVSCFMCHSNGPRAIRPNYKGLNLSIIDKTKLFIWNLRIKSYGVIKESESQKAQDLNHIIPFRYRSFADNFELNVKSCNNCHNGEDKWGNRSKLTRQNNISIKFMIENKLMPPFGFSATDNDLKEIKKFISGI